MVCAPLVFYAQNKRALLTIFSPLLLSLLPILVPCPEAKCAYVLLLMAVFLVSEALPIAITGLLPLLLIPMFGIMKSEKLAGCYMKDLTVLFLCSVALAALMEKSNLHVRVALNTMRLIGLSPNRLLTGFMLVTWLFSMWMSNAATVAMILPIIDALTYERLKVADVSRDEFMNSETSNSSNNSPKTLKKQTIEASDAANSCEVSIATCREENALPCAPHNEKIKEKIAEFAEENCFEKRLKIVKSEQKMLVLAVAFAAACGGMVTITGSSTNLVLLGQLSEYPGHGLNFASWFLMAFPISLLTMFFSWIWLTYYFCGANGVRHLFRSSGKTETESEKFIEEECSRLGKFSYEEGCALASFTVLVILWMTRDIGGIGWGRLFKMDARGAPYVTDSQAGLLVVCLCCITPCLSQINSRGKGSVPRSEQGSDRKSRQPKFLLTWSDISKIIPWDIMFLVGGGIAISEACKESGLSHWFGLQLSFLVAAPRWTILIFVVITSVVLTQFISNQAVCSIMLPVLFDMAQSLDINPMYLMFPTSLASSLAFVLPIASTSNAVAFASGHVTTAEMAKAGLVVNLIGILVLLASVTTYGSAFILDPELSWGRRNKSISFPSASLISTTNSVLESVATGENFISSTLRGSV